MAALDIWGEVCDFPTCRFAEPDYFGDPQISGPALAGLFSSGSKRADAGQVNDEGRILLWTGRRKSIFDSLVLDSQSQLFWRKPEH
jgi:hypothetical protein